MIISSITSTKSILILCLLTAPLPLWFRYKFGFFNPLKNSKSQQATVEQQKYYLKTFKYVKNTIFGGQRVKEQSFIEMIKSFEYEKTFKIAQLKIVSFGNQLQNLIYTKLEQDFLLEFFYKSFLLLDFFYILYRIKKSIQK